MIVTFCGHREISNHEIIRKKLKEILTELIKEGADTFLLGGCGEFEIIAAGVVKELKGGFEKLNSVLVIPYIDKSVDYSLYDESVYPDLESMPKKYVIIKRNDYMVDKSDTVVAFVEHCWGGAARTMEYAQKRKKRIINLAKIE